MVEAKGFVPEGTLWRPGPLGRLGRLAVGLVSLNFVLPLLLNPGWALEPGLLTQQGVWVALAISLWLIPTVVNVGFTRDWGHRPRTVALVALLAAALLSWLLYDALLAPPLALAVYLLTLYVMTHVGLAHVVAALLATPGCEMRAIPALLARLTRGRVLEHYCPGMWHRFDAWERGRQAEAVPERIG